MGTTNICSEDGLARMPVYGFDVTNLRNMRQFYLTFRNRDALRLELSWTHYRSLIRVENPVAREWYATEAATQNWSARALERQLGVLYYERLLASQDKQLVEREAQEKTAELVESPQEYLRDPYILDFLNLQDKTYQESDLERRADDNPTIGLILCSERNNTVAKYSVLNESKQLFASKYLTELPSEEELKRELEREREKALRLRSAKAEDPSHPTRKST
ncbi:PDDEXK nuclease domain-containing protein [Allohahella sp. A8]|uniref:PDDEXK nuclease domain-containing protein n=1 Tax=Allohahella sp. A8 TaxID=3141461 RepID=UPI003A7F97F5